MTDDHAATPRIREAFSTTLLMLMLATDLGFLILHVRATLQLGADPFLFLDTDGGFAEVFQYIKEYWTMLLLGLLCWRTRQGLYGVWTAFVAYLLCDDAMTIHEELGDAVGRAWHYAPALGLGPKDLGELTLVPIIGVTLLGLLMYYYPRASEDAKGATHDLVLLLGVFVFFGVFVDMLHSALDRFAVPGLIVVEDWGEMASMSLIACYVGGLYERSGRRSVALPQAIVTRFARLLRAPGARVARHER